MLSQPKCFRKGWEIMLTKYLEKNRHVFNSVSEIFDTLTTILTKSSNVESLKLAARAIGNLCFDHGTFAFPNFLM